MIGGLSIGFDWDDVVMPWHPVAVRLCREAGICPPDVDPITWHMHEEMGVSLEEWLEVIRAGTQSGALYDTEPDEDALEAMWLLWLNSHYVHVVTARGTWPDNPQNAQIHEITRAQAEKHTPWISTLTFTRDKTTVPCDYFLDDAVHNFEALRKAGVEAYLLTRPWNRDHPTEYRVDNPLEFALKILENNK